MFKALHKARASIPFSLARWRSYRLGQSIHVQFANGIMTPLDRLEDDKNFSLANVSELSVHPLQAEHFCAAIELRI